MRQDASESRMSVELLEHVDHWLDRYIRCTKTGNTLEWLSCLKILNHWKNLINICPFHKTETSLINLRVMLQVIYLFILFLEFSNLWLAIRFYLHDVTIHNFFTFNLTYFNLFHYCVFVFIWESLCIFIHDSKP